MTDEQIERFMELFRKYRNDGKLPEGEREEFRELARLWTEREEEPVAWIINKP